MGVGGDSEKWTGGAEFTPPSKRGQLTGKGSDGCVHLRRGTVSRVLLKALLVVTCSYLIASAMGPTYI